MAILALMQPMSSLPGAAYTEKNATYVNTEGRPQRATLAVFPPGDAKEDWRIVRALSEVLDKTLPLNSLGDVRGRIAEIAPQLGHIDEIEAADWGEFGKGGAPLKSPFPEVIDNFYMTNPISRASKVMQECSGLFTQDTNSGATGTDG